MAGRHAAVVRCARPVVHRRLRAVHRGSAARRGVHRGAGWAVGRGFVVGGDVASAADTTGADNRNAGAVHGDGLALGVELHAGRSVRSILGICKEKRFFFLNASGACNVIIIN